MDRQWEQMQSDQRKRGEKLVSVHAVDSRFGLRPKLQHARESLEIVQSQMALHDTFTPLSLSRPHERSSCRKHPVVDRKRFAVSIAEDSCHASDDRYAIAIDCDGVDAW